VLTVRAYAKVNLTLEALSKRDDGYHTIASLVQTIDLCDELSFAPSDRLTLRCSEPSLETPDNLALRAAALLKEHTGYPGGAEIYLDKSIPMAAGLGGGSSDAAATLKALNELWSLGLGRDDLMPLAASLGSDVPFFLLGGTAMMEGRGEVVRRTLSMPTSHLLLLVPPDEVPAKTATLYSLLDPSHYSNGSASTRLMAFIRNNERPGGKLLFNVFEEVASQVFPSLEEYRRALLEAGADTVHLTGSGPALYTLCDSEEEAVSLADNLRSAGYEPYVACTVNGSQG
jgi:4-diphosphocytidyl-2-C-methyl-D-erythritol kinase